jgi:outer membrane protein assembly factor BamB
MPSMVVLVAALALVLAAGPLQPIGPHQLQRDTRALPAPPPSGSWTTYHRDNGHTGYDPTQPTLSGVTTTAGWSLSTLDEQVFAEPLIYNGLVYAATLNNTVYALNQSDGTVVWSTHIRAPQSSGWSCGNVSPQGILGTPVIDAAGGRIYVVTLSGLDQLYRLEGLNLATGSVDLSTLITTPVGGAFDWKIQQERGALAIANGYVYVPFGGRAGDCGTYHGWVFAVPLNGGAVTHYYVTPGVGAGFWAAGGVVIDDSTGNVFVTSGNGTGSGCNANPNGTPTFENDAVVRLSPTLAHQDSFVPLDWQSNWCGNDEDLGSASPLLISPSLLFQSGKWGGGFLLSPGSLGGMNGQLYPAKTPYVQADVCHGNAHDATFGSFAYAAPFIYVECDGHGLVALNLNTVGPSFSTCGSSCGSPDWSAGGTATFGPPIVAGGAVWVVDTNGGGLYGFNMTTGVQLFHSASFGTHRFVTPSEAGGQVFVPAGTQIRSFTMAATVTFTPAQLDFNGQAPNTTSSAQTVTLHNNQPVTLNVASATLTGANSAAYLKGADTCTGASIAASVGTCTVQVSFKPTARGGFPASITFTDDASTSPQTVLLDGMGALDNQAHLYTLDRWGGLHADATAAPLTTTAYWPGWNIARGVAVFPDGLGGYVLDGWGGLHPFGNATTVTGFTYWPGWDIARQVVLAPWSTSASPAGWTLDGWGGVHQFGGAPAIAGYAYWPGWDIARGIVILPDSTPASLAGYTLDGWGGVHPFGGAPVIANFAYLPGRDIVHGMTLSPNASRTNPAGWTLDGYGGVHPFGSAPSQTTSAYWAGWDIARSIVAWTGSGIGGWVMDAWGGLHPFGSAPTVTPFAYWPGWYIAASLSGPAFASGARSTP